MFAKFATELVISMCEGEETSIFKKWTNKTWGKFQLFFFMKSQWNGDISIKDKTPFPIFKLWEKWQRHNKFLQKTSDADDLGRPRSCWHETAGTYQAAALSMLCTVTMHVIVTPTTFHIRTCSRWARRRQDCNTPWSNFRVFSAVTVSNNSA